MAANLGQTWFTLLEEVVAAQHIVAGNYPDNRDRDDRLDARLRLVDRFVKLYALELRRLSNRS
jgi:hypothetical protein